MSRAEHLDVASSGQPVPMAGERRLTEKDGQIVEETLIGVVPVRVPNNSYYRRMVARGELREVSSFETEE